MDTQSAGDELRQIAKLHPFIYVDRLERMAEAWIAYHTDSKAPKPEIPECIEIIFERLFRLGSLDLEGYYP